MMVTFIQGACGGMDFRCGDAECSFFYWVPERGSEWRLRQTMLLMKEFLLTRPGLACSGMLPGGGKLPVWRGWPCVIFVERVFLRIFTKLFCGHRRLERRVILPPSLFLGAFITMEKEASSRISGKPMSGSPWPPDREMPLHSFI